MFANHFMVITYGIAVKETVRFQSGAASGVLSPRDESFRLASLESGEMATSAASLLRQASAPVTTQVRRIVRALPRRSVAPTGDPQRTCSAHGCNAARQQ
jgi:hypothetical protein